MNPIGIVVDVLIEIPIYSSRYLNKVEWKAKPWDVLIVSARDLESMYIGTIDGDKAGWIPGDHGTLSMVLDDGRMIKYGDAFYTLVTGG